MATPTTTADTSAVTSTAVVVVGAGPTGLMLAWLLACLEVPVKVYDRNPAPTTEWRAPGIHARTMEMLARHRLLDDFLAVGSLINRLNVVWRGQAREIIATSQARSEFPYIMACAQTETERILRERLEQLGVSVHWGYEFTGYTAQGELGGATAAVTAHFKRSGTEMVHSVAAAYLVGCDGGSSKVRKSIGATFEGRLLGQHLAVCDVRTEQPLPVDVGLILEPSGVMGVIRVRSNNAYRMFAVWPEDSAPPLTAESFLSVARQRLLPIQLGENVEVLSTSAFTLHERRASRFQSVDGRVFLCGDAAHIHSPAGGQGMNTGLQDADNLAWKLAMAYHGSAQAEQLLRSYAAERIPIADQIIKLSGFLTGGLNAPRIVHYMSLVLGPLTRILPTLVVVPRIERMMQLGVEYKPADEVAVAIDDIAWRKASGANSWWRPSSWFREDLCRPGTRAYDGVVSDMTAAIGTEGDSHDAPRLRHWQSEHIGSYLALVFIDIDLLTSPSLQHPEMNCQTPLLQSSVNGLDTLHRQLEAPLKLLLHSYRARVPFAFLVYSESKQLDTDVGRDHPIIVGLRERYIGARLLMDANQGPRYGNATLAQLYGCTRLGGQHAIYLIRPDAYVAARAPLDDKAVDVLRSHLDRVLVANANR